MLKLLDHTLIMVLNGANSIIVLETEMYVINNSLRLLLFIVQSEQSVWKQIPNPRGEKYEDSPSALTANWQPCLKKRARGYVPALPLNLYVTSDMSLNLCRPQFPHLQNKAVRLTRYVSLFNFWWTPVRSCWKFWLFSRGMHFYFLYME